MPPPPIAPKKQSTKVLKGGKSKSMGSMASPRGGPDDGDYSSDDEGNTSGNMSGGNGTGSPPAPKPAINPLILHGPEEVLQLADNIADVEDFCHRLVEDLVEMVQDCMLASHVDRIAVPWTVQDVIAQLYAGMHFCISDRDCESATVFGRRVEDIQEKEREALEGEADVARSIIEDEAVEAGDELLTAESIENSRVRREEGTRRFETSLGGRSSTSPLDGLEDANERSRRGGGGGAKSPSRRSTAGKNNSLESSIRGDGPKKNTGRSSPDKRLVGGGGAKSGSKQSPATSAATAAASVSTPLMSDALNAKQVISGAPTPTTQPLFMSSNTAAGASFSERTIPIPSQNLGSSNLSSSGPTPIGARPATAEGGGGSSSSSRLGSRKLDLQLNANHLDPTGSAEALAEEKDAVEEAKRLARDASIVRAPIFSKAPHSIDFDPRYDEETWIDYRADIMQPAHIPADSWSRGVIAIRRRLFEKTTGQINASLLDPRLNGSRQDGAGYTPVVGHLDSTIGSRSVASQGLNPSPNKRMSVARPDTAAAAAGGVKQRTVSSRSDSRVGAGGVLSGAKRGSTPNAAALNGSRPSTGIGKSNRTTSNVSGKDRVGGKRPATGKSTDSSVAGGGGDDAGGKLRTVLSISPSSALPPRRSPSSAKLPSNRSDATQPNDPTSATIDLLQSSDDGLKEEDKRIIAEDRAIREQMARLKAGSDELSRQLLDVKTSANYIVDQRAGKVIMQQRSDRMEAIEGSISAAQAVATSPTPPPSSINNGTISGIIPMKIVTEGGSAAGERSDAEIAAAEEAALQAILDASKSTRGLRSPPRPGSPTQGGLANVSAIAMNASALSSGLSNTINGKEKKAPRPKKLPTSAYYAVETRVANPMIASQVIPSGGVSSKEGDSILSAELPLPQVVAGVRPMSKQEFIRAQKYNGSPPPEVGGGAGGGGVSMSMEENSFNTATDIINTDEEGGGGKRASAGILNPIVTERPQSTPPDIGAAAAAAGGKGVTRKKIVLSTSADDDANGNRPASSLLAKFGKLSTTITNAMATDESATGAFNAYRNGGAALPPRPASTANQPALAGRGRRDVFVPNASKLSQQEAETQQALLYAQQQRLKNNSSPMMPMMRSGQLDPLTGNNSSVIRPGSTASSLTPVVVPSRKHFKPIFDDRGNVRPATTGMGMGASALNGGGKTIVNASGQTVVSNAGGSNAGDSLAATNALKYVLAKRSASAAAKGGAGGYEAVDVDGSGGDLLDVNSRPTSKGW